MSSQMFTDYAKFNASSDMKFTQPRVNAAGGKNVGVINDKTKKGLVLTTPLMLTWGMNEYRDEASGKVTYDLSLQFPSDNYPNPDATVFLEKLEAMEEEFKKAASTKAKEWFNKPTMSSEVVDALWTPMLRYKKDADGMPDKSSAPSLRIKVPFWEGNWKVELYDTEGVKQYPCDDSTITPMALLPKLTNVALIIQNGGVWFANGKFGTTWKLVQGVVKPRASLFGKCHINLNSEQKAVMERQNDGDDNNDEYETTVVADSDDEDDSQVESQPEPEPEPKPEPAAPVKKPKKRVVKKSGGD